MEIGFISISLIAFMIWVLECLCSIPVFCLDPVLNAPEKWVLHSLCIHAQIVITLGWIRPNEMLYGCRWCGLYSYYKQIRDDNGVVERVPTTKKNIQTFNSIVIMCHYCCMYHSWLFINLPLLIPKTNNTFRKRRCLILITNFIIYMIIPIPSFH